MSDLGINSFRTSLAALQDSGPSKPAPEQQQRADTGKPVIGPAGSAFEGRQISAQSGSADGADAKKFSLSSFVRNSLPVQKGAQLVEAMATRLGRDGVASVAHSLKTGVLEQARLEQATLREDLGTPDSARPGILDKGIPVAGSAHDVKVADLLEDLRITLGGDKRISSQEMQRYVVMGERIVEALNNSSDGKPPLQATVNGKTVTIPSNVDTARAVSWFLQAKGMVDNADAGRTEVATGKAGSMLIKDPGNKLYNFLSAAPSCYGRTSTHLKAHSENTNAASGFKQAFAETGVVSALTVSKGGALQRGIEDYSSKLPGGGGTMLFDRIKPDSSGDALLFLKLEPVGTPTSFSFFGRHVDPAEGFSRSVQALASVAGRNVEHGAHLLESIYGKMFKSEEAYRGEKIEKGPTKAVFKAFEAELEKAGGLSDDDKSDMLTAVKRNGVTGMISAIDNIKSRAAGADGLDPAPFDRIGKDLTALVGKMGTDLGIDRRGNEVHCTLQ